MEHELTPSGILIAIYGQGVANHPGCCHDYVGIFYFLCFLGGNLQVPCCGYLYSLLSLRYSIDAMIRDDEHVYYGAK